MKISSKIIISILLASVGTIIFVSSFVYISVSNVLQEHIRENQFSSAQHLTEGIRNVVNQGYADIKNIAAEAPIIHVLGGVEMVGQEHYDTDVSDMPDILSNLVTYTGPWHYLSVVNNNGEVIFSSAEDQQGRVIKGGDINEIAYKEALGGKAYVSELNRNNGYDPVIIFSAPVYAVRDLSGQPVMGVVIGHFMWSNVEKVLTNHESHDTYLFNKEGYLIGSDDPEKKYLVLSTDYSKNEVIKHLLADKQNMVMTIPSFIGDFKSLSAHLEEDYRGNKWILLIEEDIENAFAPAKETAISIFLIIAPFISLFSIILLLVLRQIVISPIKKLTQVAEKIAVGNLNTRADVKTSDEIGQLANSFNYMVKKLDEKSRKLLSANDKLKKIDATKSEFISIASHQLLTPLTVVKGYISMIFTGALGKVNSKMQNAVMQINNNNDRLIDLVRGLLNVSRIESGKMDFEFKREKIESLLAELKEFFSLVAKNKKLDLILDMPKKSLPLIVIDKMKMHEVISNLIDNSIKYTPQGGITIKAEKRDKYVRVTISDTGIGFKKEDVVYLFEKFARLKNKEAEEIKGTGLGLYFAKKIVDAHKGRMWAESPGLNKGASFIIELPIG